MTLAACSVGPKYRHPDIPLPADWPADTTRTPAEAAAAASAPNTGITRTNPPAGSPTPSRGETSSSTATPASTARWPSTDWWQGFGSPGLNELLHQAQQANDDIAAAIARVRQAEAQVLISGAPLWPALSVVGSGSRELERPVIPTPGAPVTFSQFSVLPGATYELDFWGKNRAVLDAAKLAATASRYDRATVELTILTSVGTTYFEVLELRDRLDVAEQNLGTAQTILKDLLLEERVGTATALDVAQQETTVAELNASIPPLRQQLRQTVDALAVLVGKMPQELEMPGGTLTGLSIPQVSPGLPSQLLARRPDVAAAEANLMAANANIAAARAAFFPTIDLTANGGFVSTALSSLFSPINRAFTVGGELTQPVFQGGALLGGYRLSKARYAELLADYHKAVISAFSNVEDALVGAQQTAEQYRREQIAVEKARRAYDFTQTQLRAGTVNVLTVLNTQTALFTAQDTLVQVRFAHLQALIQLFNALGGGWQTAANQS